MKPASLPNIRIVYRGQTDHKNQELRYRPNFEEQRNNSQVYDFKNKLDFRDEVIRVPLKIKKEDQVLNSSFQPVILNWLAQMVENILSASFRQILSQNLTVLQSKAYASKNILLNIKQTCVQINRVCKTEIDIPFMQFLDQSLQEIISEIINKYPQQNTKGASRKVNDFIKKISSRQNDEYDFLYKNNITIRYNPTGDYSQDIMKIINKIINIPQQIAKKVNQNSNTNRKDVLFQEFHSFCSNLFFMSNKQISENNLRYSTVNYAPQITSRWQFKNLNEDVEHNINNTLEGKKSIKFEHIVPDFNEQQLRIDISESHAQKLIEARSQITQQFLKFEEKKGQFYAICQKIPSEVKTFDQKEIRSGHFRVYHASISRVLTKWAQSLYEKFESASQKIRYRLFKFKTNEKKISYNDFQIGETKLRYCQVEEKEFLYQAVINRKIKVDEYMDYLKRKNKNLQAVLSSQYLEGTYLKKFTDVGIFAGRTQEILNQMTFSYLNYLIHSLLLVSLEASENIFQNYRIYEDNISKAEQKKCALSGINLVNFNVGDLLRARYICLEHEFINVLAFLYKIEEMNPLFLKIVKIKNRLDDNNNDILINFFFKNTITCELQLAIFKETNKKEKIYSQFNHFLYELKRSSFGVISALSNVIAQHDPIVNYFTFSKMKHPKLIKSTKNTTFKDGQVVKENFFQKFFMYKNNRQRIIDKPFICSECKLLRIVHNTKFYERNQELQSVCNSCIEKRLKISTCSLQSSNISHQILLLMSSLFRYYIMDQKILEFIKQIKLWSPTQELKDVKDQTELYARFLQYGFIIQKDEKLPKVRFFKKFYNPMKNIMILSTVMGGRVSNFLRLDCKKNGASMILMSQLAKFLVFSLKNMQQQHFKDLVEQNYISQENQEANFLDVLKLKHRQILKIEYITQIESSFDKNYSTLYLNNYKFALDYLEEYIHIQGRTYCGVSSSLKKKALCVTNLELQSCQISLLKCVLSEFVNLKQLNISSNSIRDIKVLQKLTQLQVINVSHNKVTSIKPVYELKELVVIVASDNIISQLQLQDFHLIVKLLKLDCSRNSITRLKGIEALQNIKSLVLQHNFIEQMSGIRSLHYLQKLLLNNNKLQQIVGIECLQNLKELDLSQNQKIRDFPLINNQYKLATLNISGNFLTAITPMLCKNLKILNLSKNKIQKIENLDSLMQLQELDLSLNHIHRIQNLQDLLKLKILLLQSNKITVIENLEKLKMLQKVVISFNPIKQTTSLNHLKYLSHLDIEHCEIEAIRELNKLKRIKTLDLSNNKIKKIFQIDELVRIQNLDLGDNKITKIENLQYLKYLQSLSLMNNHITKIQNLGELTQLQWIILSGNKIRKLQHLEGLESLHILQIEKNSIQKIENLETLVDLSELWLSDNRITHISGLEKLEKLKRLGLAKNNISKVEGLKELHNLQFLDLQGNQLTQLENLDCLGSLKWLVASVNNIKKIDGLSQLWKLQTLFLEHNQITVIQNLNKLTRLTYLKLEFNKIAKISGLNYLENLEKLYLECNEIAKIEGLQNLYKLNELILKNNYIAKIQNLQHLTNLQFLDLSYNSIQKHENLEDLRCLKRLYLQNNKIEMLNSLDFPVIMEEVKNISDSPSQLTSWETKNRIKFNLGALLRRFEQDSQTHSQEKPQEGETQNNGEDQRGKEVINVCKPDVPEAMKMTIQKNVVSPRYLASEASQRQNETLKARQKFVHNFTKKLNTRIL